MTTLEYPGYCLNIAAILVASHVQSGHVPSTCGAEKKP